MFIKPTPELLQQIKDSGKPIIQITMEEFQKIASEGRLLTNEEAKEILEWVRTEYPNDDTLEKATEIINNYQPE